MKLENFFDNLEVMLRLKDALEDSAKHIVEIDLMSINSFREWEPVDAFFDRFERLVDNLFQATLRSLYYLENLSFPTTLMDLMTFTKKVGICNDIDFLIELKQLRNKLAHEYIGFGIANTQNAIDEILEKLPYLFEIVENVKNYSRKYQKD